MVGPAGSLESDRSTPLRAFDVFVFGTVELGSAFTPTFSTQLVHVLHFTGVAASPSAPCLPRSDIKRGTMFTQRHTHIDRKAMSVVQLTLSTANVFECCLVPSRFYSVSEFRLSPLVTPQCLEAPCSVGTRYVTTKSRPHGINLILNTWQMLHGTKGRSRTILLLIRVKPSTTGHDCRSDLQTSDNW